MKRITIVLASVILIAISFVSSNSDVPATSARLQVTASAPPAFAWAKTWTGNKDVNANNVAVDPSGNLYVVGEFWGTVDFDPAGPNMSATVTSTKTLAMPFSASLIPPAFSNG